MEDCRRHKDYVSEASVCRCWQWWSKSAVGWKV